MTTMWGPRVADGHTYAGQRKVEMNPRQQFADSTNQLRARRGVISANRATSTSAWLALVIVLAMVIAVIALRFLPDQAFEWRWIARIASARGVVRKNSIPQQNQPHPDAVGNNVTDPV